MPPLAHSASADDEPRFAAVRFDRDRAGRPVPPARRLEYAERAAVVAYLRESPVVVANWGYDPDPLDPEHTEVVPAHLHTDGRWVWPESLAYFAERYGVPPEPELLAHIEERRYEWPAEVDDEILDRIGRLLRAGRTPRSG
ncbi:hypothetical protein ABGB07_27410 [Micromonosporaceae bacterium B7E4]